jgi:hypothetical protein
VKGYNDEIPQTIFTIWVKSTATDLPLDVDIMGLWYSDCTAYEGASPCKSDGVGISLKPANKVITQVIQYICC